MGSKTSGALGGHNDLLCLKDICYHCVFSGQMLSWFGILNILNILLFLVGFGRRLLSEWLNFTKTMEMEQNWVAAAVKQDFTVQKKKWKNIYISTFMSLFEILMEVRVNKKVAFILRILSNQIESNMRVFVKYREQP